MAEAALRIYMLFLCVNLVLMLCPGPIAIDSQADLVNKTYGANSTTITSTSTSSTLLTLIFTLKDFLLGGGIAAMLISTGMPREIQLLIGVPMLVMAYFALAPLLTGILNLLGIRFTK